MNTPPTQVILDQICVAFGQGTGPTRVTAAAAEALRGFYAPAITEEVAGIWDGVAAQALERARATGRLADQLATERAAMAIGPREAVQAAQAVSQVSNTPICPQPPFPPTPGEDDDDILGLRLDAVAHRAAALTQLLIAFGQGTGTVRVARAAVAVVRDRFAQPESGAGCERLRALGRKASQVATTRASTAIAAEDVLTAGAAIERARRPAMPAAAYRPEVRVNAH